MTNQQTKELQQKIEQLQFELKAADSDYHYKTKELQKRVEEKDKEIKRLTDSLLDLATKSANKVVELQAKIDELESELTIQKEKVKLNYNHAIDLQAKCCKCEVLGDLAPCDECYYGRTN